MDNTVQLASLLEATTYAINCYTEGEHFSSGSGFCISPDGVILTAAHVITGRTPLRKDDVKDPSLRIVARTSSGPSISYRPVTIGIKVNGPCILKEPLEIDLAILAPLEKLEGLPCLEVPNSIYPSGTQVLMAGFPDELEMPLMLNRAIDKASEAYLSNISWSEEAFVRMQELLMIKSGMVGHAHHLDISSIEGKEWSLQLASYYIDNVMHSGSSGGPVIDAKGRAFAIITKRAVTTVSNIDLDDPNKEIPSGSALALSSFTITDYVKRQNGYLHNP